jgi:hypothetical protein
MNITLRDWFAAHAPNEMPDWFIESYKWTPKPKQPNPSDDKYLHRDVNPSHKADEAQLRGWMNDGCYDLPEHLRAFQDDYVQWNKDCEAWDNANRKLRFFAWREAYADGMTEPNAFYALWTALNLARPIVAEMLRMEGLCDHEANICVCGLKDALEDIDLALEKAKGTAERNRWVSP